MCTISAALCVAMSPAATVDFVLLIISGSRAAASAARQAALRRPRQFKQSIIPQRKFFGELLCKHDLEAAKLLQANTKK